MSKTVLQWYEHDTVHEHNEAGWESEAAKGSNGAWIYVALKQTVCITHTHTELCHGVMVTDCCTRVVH